MDPNTIPFIAAPFIKKLVELQTLDPETAHIRADDVLCDLLTRLGYQEVVEEYRKISKWYS